MNLLLAVSAFAVSSLSADEKADAEGFVPLFDGKSLKGWTAAKSTGENNWGAFSVNEKEKAIHAYAGEKPDSKQKSDCLNSEAEFSHFILKVEYKWLGPRFAPREKMDRDAGLLFHVHGNLKKVWPLSVEMQIGESDVSKSGRNRFHSGDLFVLGKDLRAKTPRIGGSYSKDGKLVTGKGCPTQLGVEKPKGEWNEMEIRVEGSKKATFILNGEEVLEVFDMEEKNKDGKYVPLSKGRIGLQAEWAEILYRNIRIKELPSDGK
ncbi:MAG: 3-keto-disaccharide hydrolase [Akkermansiaceae bacterium]